MVRLTQSLAHWLFENHREKLPLIMFGHLELFTDEMKREYLAWCKTGEGAKYLKGGSEYKKELDPYEKEAKMKTPEEIKKGLGKDCGECDEENFCPYIGIAGCIAIMHEDALALIRQLEAENAELKRERDAAVKDIYINSRCAACKKYFKNGGKCSGAVFCIPLEFEWRGPCEENGGQKEEEK